MKIQKPLSFTCHFTLCLLQIQSSCLHALYISSQHIPLTEILPRVCPDGRITPSRPVYAAGHTSHALACTTHHAPPARRRCSCRRCAPSAGKMPTLDLHIAATSMCHRRPPHHCELHAPPPTLHQHRALQG
jgi:hypothetical protein